MKKRKREREERVSCGGRQESFPATHKIWFSMFLALLTQLASASEVWGIVQLARGSLYRFSATNVLSSHDRIVTRRFDAFQNEISVNRFETSAKFSSAFVNSAESKKKTNRVTEIYFSFHSVRI